MASQIPFSSAHEAIVYTLDYLKINGMKVDPGRWQGVPTEGKPDLVTKEVLDTDCVFPIPHTMEDAQKLIEPNLPWAEAHFQERVSRVPSNPGEEYKNWPWWRGQFDVTAAWPEGGLPHGEAPEDHLFSHTYQERFWPKEAGNSYARAPLTGFPEDEGRTKFVPTDMRGIRYPYGDLDDVIDLLRRDPQSRQAYFPIFFPEDTGAVHGGRIPCTLGYHFLLRSGLLHCWYDIRSCDAVRHFRDDLYLAVRLVQWVLAELVEKELRSDTPQVWVDVNPGYLFFKAHSFHVHMGDYHLLP